MNTNKMTRLQAAVKSMNKQTIATLKAEKRSMNLPFYTEDLSDLPMSVSLEGEGINFDPYDFIGYHTCFTVGDQYWDICYFNNDLELSTDALYVIKSDFKGYPVREAFDAVLGKTWRLPSYIKGQLRFYELSKTEAGRELLRSIDVSYIDYIKDRKMTVGKLLQLGCTHESIYRGYGKDIKSELGLITRKKIIAWVNSYTHVSLFTFISFGEVEYQDIIPAVAGNGLSEREVPSLDVWAWCQNHVEWSNKSKEVHGPGGRSFLLHNHQLIREMTDSMLVRGLKTSPTYIEEMLEERAKALIEEQAKNSKDLPKLEVNLPAGVVQLTNSLDLLEEGKKMNHCVGGYIEACLQEESYIFHINDGSDEGATAEISPNPWRVVQVRGRNNKKPLSYAYEAMEDIISSLKKERS